VKRAVAVVAVFLAALAVAAPASAKVPPAHGGSVLGRNLPLKVYASVNPPVQLFADTITAKVAVVADRKWVDPANLRPVVHFAPYQATGLPTEVRTVSGRFVQTTWTWTLDCLTPKCVPVTGSSDISHIFRFSPAHVEYLSPTGKVEYAVDARFQPVEALSELSPSVVTGLEAHVVNWQFRLTPVPTPRYRLTPSLVFWLAAALAAVLGAAGLAVAGRWALQFLPAAAAQGPAAPASSLERALTLFFWARAHDDETLQRKALERVADELPFDVHELSETARALAWSRETPETEDVEAISERAGVHRRNGEPEL
jgi:hypothetical protein